MVVRIGKGGRVHVPKKAMERLGLREGEALIAEVSEEGTLVLRSAGAYPIETYDDRRVEEFLEADSLTQEEKEKISGFLRDDGVNPRRGVGSLPRGRLRS
ncbi:MAG: AbrB/MazE/SpoVT family DNA-binding domain-containing protein [Rubrobacter sp.]|nr:AbrB/MazE/SpoVT family DNA-binding domain-containing protein [Rubrobacter sp.]